MLLLCFCSPLQAQAVLAHPFDSSSAPDEAAWHGVLLLMSVPGMQGSASLGCGGILAGEGFQWVPWHVHILGELICKICYCFHY